MAYIFDINSNTIDSHQTSPSWVVTFVRWNNRASSQVFDKDIKDKEGNLDRKKGVRGPLVVHSDAINISVQNGKTTVTPGCQIVLKGGDINYSTAISPGDYIFINILNSEQKANDVVKRANSLLPINRAEDGFKGIFKVKGCRRRLSIDGSGKKQLVYVCTGFAFTELNSDIYFNPYLFQQEEAKAIEFITALGKQWNSLISQKTQMLNQDIIKLLIQVFIGSGFSETAKRTKTGDLRNFNSTFLIPPEIKNLLGVKKAERVADITNIIMGVEKYSTKPVSDPQSTGDGEFTNYKDVFNPGIVNAQDTDGRFYETANKLQGNSQVKPEYWSQVKAWSILQQYLNAPMNECFTSFRIAPDSNKVMPTLTFRQIIFTKDNVKTAIPVTQYLSLPRWNRA